MVISPEFGDEIAPPKELAPDVKFPESVLWLIVTVPEYAKMAPPSALAPVVEFPESVLWLIDTAPVFA
jgi:hypothetical protein